MVRRESARNNNLTEYSQNIIISNLQTENDKIFPNELYKPAIEEHLKEIQMIKINNNISEQNNLSPENHENNMLSFKNTNEIPVHSDVIATNQSSKSHFYHLQ